MYVLINHCWCRDCNWGGQYDCRVIVSIDRIAEGKTYYDPPMDDWTNLIEKHEYEWKDEVGFLHHDTNRLKPEIMQWLTDNIKDRKLLKWEMKRGENPKGWAVGTDLYNARDQLSFSVFFERTGDALKFIKRWSVYKKPVDYLNYFRDVRKKLDPKTNTLRRVPRWND